MMKIAVHMHVSLYVCILYIYVYTSVYSIWAGLCGYSNPKRGLNLNSGLFLHVQSYVKKPSKWFSMFSCWKMHIILLGALVVSLPNLLRNNFTDFYVLPSLAQPFAISFSDILKHSSCNLVADRGI